MSIEVIESHSIVSHLVPKRAVVVDCGANVGAFSLAMIQRFGCRSFAFEPSPNTFLQIPQSADLKAYNVAVCGNCRKVSVSIYQDSTRSNIIDRNEGPGSTVDIDGMNLCDLLKEVGVPDVIDVLKIDIEGAELEVLDSLPEAFFNNIGQLTIEFHDFLGYYSASQVCERIDRIVSLGFRELFISKARNNMDVLLVNKRRMGIVRYLYEQEAVRRIKALCRIVRRRLDSLVDRVISKTDKDNAMGPIANVAFIAVAGVATRVLLNASFDWKI